MSIFNRKRSILCLFVLCNLFPCCTFASAAQYPPLKGFQSSKENRPLATLIAPAEVTPIIPIIFPVLGKVSWSNSFAPNGEGGMRRHHGQDLIAPKMRPLVAALDGRVFFTKTAPGGHNILTLAGDNGCRCLYMHINNDTPGTNDGLGSEEYAYPATMHSGDHVNAGQLIAFVGNSGNAENVCPHCHFEMWLNGRCINPAPSLRSARVISEPVASNIFPEIQSAPDEIRFDGVVSNIDTASGVLTISLASTKQYNKNSRSIIMPTRKSLNLKLAAITGVSQSGSTLKLTDLQEGMGIIAVGKQTSSDQSVQVRLCKITYAPRSSPNIESMVQNREVKPMLLDKPEASAPYRITKSSPSQPYVSRQIRLVHEEQEVFEDFENGTYFNWTLEGNCWQHGPSSESWFPGKITGFEGGYFACTFDKKEGVYATGKAVSREFEIGYKYIYFRIGGGNHPQETCFNLVIDGRIAATSTGDNTPELRAKRWNVGIYGGRKAHLEIVDSSMSKDKGYIMVDSIIFREKLQMSSLSPKY